MFSKIRRLCLKFSEILPESDDTDTMSEAGSQSMLLMNDSMLENENDKNKSRVRRNRMILLRFLPQERNL